MDQPPPPLVRKVDCLRIPVPSLEDGLAFYRDQLGHELLWRSDSAVGLRLPESDAELVLHVEAQPPEVDLLVASADEAAARIVAAGGSIVVPPFDIQIGRCVIVADPWGTRLVLLDASKGLLSTDSEGNVTGTRPPQEP